MIAEQADGSRYDIWLIYITQVYNELITIRNCIGEGI